MKKAIASLMAVIMILSLTGCGAESTVTPAGSNTDTASAEKNTAISSEPAAAEKKSDATTGKATEKPTPTTAAPVPTSTPIPTSTPTPEPTPTEQHMITVTIDEPVFLGDKKALIMQSINPQGPDHTKDFTDVDTSTWSWDYEFDGWHDYANDIYICPKTIDEHLINTKGQMDKNGEGFWVKYQNLWCYIAVKDMNLSDDTVVEYEEYELGTAIPCGSNDYCYMYLVRNGCIYELDEDASMYTPHPWYDELKK